jgi:hypothetical protein
MDQPAWSDDRRCEVPFRHFGLGKSVRFVGLVEAASILITGRSDKELIAPEAQTARLAVLPLHENLELVGVPDDAHAANAHLELLDLISLVWDLVIPPHDFSPWASSGKWQKAGGLSGRSYARTTSIDSSIDA